MAFQKTKIIIFFALILFSFAAHAQNSGTSLYIVPSAGTYAVGDTLTVSLYVNTAGSSINAIEAGLTFPPDKLQIVSPSAGKSVIELWVGQPSFSNSVGTVNFQGTIPNPGLNTARGLISTITFRVKSTGKAVIDITDNSKVLLNDGKGTNVLNSTSGTILDLVLPPPQGPTVTSPTHPDQSRWYGSNNIVLKWSGDNNTDSYSYLLDSEPVTVPDDIPEQNKEEVSYAKIEDGAHYFHIKAHAASVWGGVTHFAVRLDTTPTADFKINVEPSSRTTQLHPIINFSTTDVASGLEHYEIKIIPLSPVVHAATIETLPQGFYVEAESPYIPELVPGKYDILVRAFDVAGNAREVKERLAILTSTFQVIEWITPSNPWTFILLIVFLICSVVLSRKYHLLHTHVSSEHTRGALRSREVSDKLEKLKEYQRRYGQLVLILTMGIIFSSLFSTPISLYAQSPKSVAVPIISTISDNLTNDELFYVGGKYPAEGATVTIYLENQDTGETRSFLSVSDKSGDWFYAHSDFLPVGRYVLWVQAQIGDVKSPPSSQITLEVEATAISIGSSHVSFEILYLTLSLLFMIATLVLSIRAAHYYRLARRRQALLSKEIAEAEASIHRGFALIRRDIEDELQIIAKLKTSNEFRSQEKEKEKKLLDDLREIEEMIGKEVWDVRIASQE